MSEYPTGPVMVWELAGRPHRATLGVTAAEGVCAMCARRCTETAPAKKWLEGKSFTDPAHLRARSGRVCEACAWAVTGKGMDQIRMWTIVAHPDPVPSRQVTPKELRIAQTRRTWGLRQSHPKARFATDRLHFTSRADTRAVVDTLADPPAGQWLVVIAESGQKHTLPYAQINQGGGRWRVRMDALDVDATPHEFRHVLAHALVLRQAGHTAEEVERLEPSFARLKTMDDLALWREHATALEPWRAAPLLHLAVFLITKERINEYRTRYPAYGPDHPGGQVPGHDARQRGRRDDRTHRLVGPGPHRAGDRSVHGDRLF